MFKPNQVTADVRWDDLNGSVELPKIQREIVNLKKMYQMVLNGLHSIKMKTFTMVIYI